MAMPPEVPPEASPELSAHASAQTSSPTSSAPRTAQSPGAPDLDHVETWLFDLDNTLYHPETGLLDQVNVLMTAFISEELGVDPDTATQLRRDYWLRFGATLTGMVQEHGVAPEHFLEATHRLDLAALAPDPALRAALVSLPGRRAIHTNGPRHHAMRILAALELTDLFDGIVTLEDTGLVPKPAASAHAQAIAMLDLDPEKTLMVDDTAANLAHPATLGMTTVWLRHSPVSTHTAATHPAATTDAHIVTEDLIAFLRGTIG